MNICQVLEALLLTLQDSIFLPNSQTTYTNMSFTQSSQGTLATREASPEEQKFITDILKLYQLEPSEQSYSHYADTAVFHDPVSIAKGKESVMSQFNGMPKIFARSDTKGTSRSFVCSNARC